MPRMPATIAALQQGQVVRVARLVQFDFASETIRVHQNAGPIRTADGAVWSGLGELGTISDIERAVVPSNGGPSFALSGVEPHLIAKTLEASEETKGRPVRIFDQHFTGEYALLDAPLAVWVGLMDRMTIQDDGATATIAVTTVTLLYKRRRPAFAYLNAASQRRLYPNDGGADQLARLVQANEKWPAY